MAKSTLKPQPQPKLYTQVCQTFRLPEPKPEYKFHSERQWRIDYYFEANGRKVALEVEGGVHTGGRHTNPKGFLNDIEKYNALAVAGIFLVRCTPDTLMNVSTFTTIKQVLYGQQD